MPGGTGKACHHLGKRCYKCPKGDFFLGYMPVVAFDDKTVNNLPDNEQPEHEPAHYLDAVVKISTPHEQRNTHGCGNTGLVIGKLAVFGWFFHLVRE